MHVTLHTDFALRVLIPGGINDGCLSTIKDVADSFGISKNHLMKAVNHLEDRGYRETVRGRNGGIRLTICRAASISAGRARSKTNSRFSAASTAPVIAASSGSARRAARCDAVEAFLAVLDRYTLAELIAPHQALSQLPFDAAIPRSHAAATPSREENALVHTPIEHPRRGAARASGRSYRMNSVTIRHAESEAEVAACFPVMVLLRPHLSGVEEFVTRVARQRLAGYRLLAAWCDATPVGLAGYRFEENLIRGKFVYVDDLVTAAEARGNRIGARLLDAVSAIGRDAACAHLVLDTALDNVLAHRFYYRQGMLARALRFSQPLAPR